LPRPLYLEENGRQEQILKATIELINQMQADGVIAHYAIGGAVGATFYLEPAATLDVDVFVLLSHPGGALISLTPIYEYLKARGGVEDKEHIVLGDWPVQFLSLLMNWSRRLWQAPYPWT
jgi:hypothetical protein